MSRRTQRVGNLIRQALGEALLSKLSDPRIDPARTSIVRVEIPEDLLTAKVFVSVLGTDGQQKRALRGLRHASGHLQELMMQRISLRNTPILSFELDTRFKKTLETLDIIQRVTEEIQAKERSEQARGEAPATPQQPKEDQPVQGSDPS